jgi:hypothetical protein
MTSVRSPAAAQKAAQVDPAGPPPATATSNISIWLQSRKMMRKIKAFRALSFRRKLLEP